MDYNEKTAKNYDRILYPAFHRIRKNVVKIAKKLDVESIADFCCGTGNQLKYLQKAGFNNILGVDLSENMMSQAKIGEFQGWAHTKVDLNRLPCFCGGLYCGLVKPSFRILIFLCR